MSSLAKGMILVAVILLSGVGLVFWKNTVGGHRRIIENISKEEMELLLKDIQNPMLMKRLAEDPAMKKELANNVKELFAVAAQAEHDGLTADVNIKRELDNIEKEILATNYDKQINADKGSMPQFGFIGEDRVKAFWDATDVQPGFLDRIGLGDNSAAAREKAFQNFIKSKLKLAQASGMPPRDLTEEEQQQAREYFAKTRIYSREAFEKRGELGDEFWRKVDLQTKLQKAQFLARMYSQKGLAEKVKVTDEEIKKYIEAHPELAGKEEKRGKAQEILNRVKAGEDFAKLAQEFSEDPGSKSKGGLYEGITQGAFDPTFESAALALEPGQFTQELVETRFGFHIIKLENKRTAENANGNPNTSMDVRHILISTMFRDPENPMAQEVPVNEYVRSKLEKEKEEKLLEEIKKNNPVAVAENFDVVVPEMPQQQQLPPGMMMPQDMPTDAPQKPAPKGNETKKTPPKK
ncbi:MAG TPA: peptidylprolyl isomerase [Pyrinomonadaceae bacterium]|nr:peptidylprolyl isomerase [Pyrinomonadaceae bacterium]